MLSIFVEQIINREMQHGIGFCRKIMRAKVFYWIKIGLAIAKRITNYDGESNDRQLGYSGYYVSKMKLNVCLFYPVK